MSKSKAVPQTGTVKIYNQEISYQLVRNDQGVQALWFYKGRPIRTKWRTREQLVGGDVMKSYQMQLDLEVQHATELRKLQDWNAGRPIFGGGGTAASSGPLIDNGSDGAA